MIGRRRSPRLRVTQNATAADSARIYQVAGDLHQHHQQGEGRVVSMARSAYLHQVRRVFPGDLVGREAELAELGAFCTRERGLDWMWWQAPAWAGKSALLAWFVLHPPAGVQVVSFFITSRLAGQGTRSAFVDVVLEQLAEVAEEPIPVL